MNYINNTLGRFILDIYEAGVSLWNTDRRSNKTEQF